jgi:hypothetical protein
MGRDPFADLRRWLKAEGHDDRAADAALRGVFAWVPRKAPPADFADRVVGAAVVGGLLTADSPWARAWVRVAVGLGLVMTGLAVFAATVASPRPDLASLVRAWVAAVAGGAAWFGRVLEVGLSIWRLCGKLGVATAMVAATPEVGCMLAANAVLALAACWGLRRLLGPREEMVSW